MTKNKRHIYQVDNLSNALYYLRIIPNMQVFGSCTRLKLDMQEKKLPQNMLILKDVKELQLIEKHERFIDFGSQVTLTTIEELGINKLPQILYEALTSIDSPFIKNIATIGGNICTDGIKGTLYAPLLALESRIELKNANETRLIPLTKFTEVPPNFLLSKIRIPIEEWDISVFKRLGNPLKIDDTSGSFAFLAKTKKGILTEIRIAFAGFTVLRNTELENQLIGSRLPLSNKNIESILDDYREFFIQKTDKKALFYHPILKDQYLNLIHYCLHMLSR